MKNVVSEETELFAGCSRKLGGRPSRTPAEELADLQSYAEQHDLGLDRYGGDGATDVLCERVADLLGFPAAAFVPSGTMAQQVAYRLWAEDAGTPTIALHHTSHLLNHEAMAHEHLSGLQTLVIGPPWTPRSVVTIEDVEAITDPVAAIGLEIPQRDSAGRLPDWDDVTAIRDWASDRGTALHLDGARVWEAAAGYGRRLDDVTAPFDSVYVSFYKGIGAMAGSALLGSEEFVARARTWIHRYGGRLFQSWPMTIAALRGLDQALPEMAGRLEHARAIAAACRDLDGVRVDPDPPHTSQVNVHIEADPQAVVTAAEDIARERSIAITTMALVSDVPGWCWFEVGVGPSTQELTATEIAELLSELRDRANAS